MFEVDNRMDLIRPALLKNDFWEILEFTFVNDNCKVEVDLEEEVYNIYYKDKQKVSYIITSDNLNLYFLFGFLSAHDLIDRNFKL